MQTLDNSITTYREARRRSAAAAHLATGPRRPEPDLDPGRQRGRTPDGRASWAAPPAATSASCSTGRSPPTSSAAARSATPPETGVIDPYHRVYGHPGLHVVDGSAISANLGVNPSLTITAQAERAMALWPNKGEPDPRPALGAAYRRWRRSRRARRSSRTRAPGGAAAARSSASPDRPGALPAELFCGLRVTRAGARRWPVRAPSAPSAVVCSGRVARASQGSTNLPPRSGPDLAPGARAGGAGRRRPRGPIPPLVERSRDPASGSVQRTCGIGGLDDEVMSVPAA